MDSGNMSPGRAPAEDNGENENDSVLSGKLEMFGKSKVGKNGSIVDNHSIEPLPDVNGKGTEPSVSVISSPLEMKPKKGYGLKKWRRIKRDIIRGRDSSLDTEQTMMHEPSNLVTNPCKRTQVYVDRQKKSEGSVSSLNPMVSDFGAFVGPSVDSVGMDSENGDDRSSRSSTAASFPRAKYDTLPVVGFPLDKVKMGNLGGNNPSVSGKNAQAGKGQAESTKKARGELAKMEKENSPSSMESDLRTSNFLFVKGNHAMSNGVRGKNGHKVQDCEGQFGNGGEDLSWDSKKERGKNHGSSSDHDPLLESMCRLIKAQEALEEEVLKFKEIGKEGIHSDITDFENESKGESNFSPDLQSSGEVEKAEAELEELFMQKIEAEVEYLAISRTVRRLRADAVDQTTIPFYQKSAALELTRNRLGDNKDVLLEKDGEKLQSLFEDIDSTLKLQKRVCKYTLCVLVQLPLLFIMFTLFRFKISSDYSEVVPT